MGIVLGNTGLKYPPTNACPIALTLGGRGWPGEGPALRLGGQHQVVRAGAGEGEAGQAVARQDDPQRSMGLQPPPLPGHHPA